MSTKKDGTGMKWVMLLLEGVFGSVESIIEGVITSVKQTTTDIIRNIARRLLVLFLVLLGVIFFLVGGARMLSDLLQRPGLGETVVGMGVFLIALVLYASTRENS